MKDVALKLRETAARLIKQAEMLELGIDINKCASGEGTNVPFKGCKTCGKTYRVKCKFKKYGFVNSGGCFPYNEITKKGCKNFTPGSAGHQPGSLTLKS